MTLPIEVIRSPKRRKTVSAEIRAGVLVVRIPARMSRAEERLWVDKMRQRLDRPPATSDADLERRAISLADRHRLPHPSSIKWASQTTRWGSATSLDRSVRISDQLRGEPDWVIDYVIIHELAHLAVPDHSPEFWSLVNRYPLTERARGFLMARETATPTR